MKEKKNKKLPDASPAFRIKRTPLEARFADKDEFNPRLSRRRIRGHAGATGGLHWTSKRSKQEVGSSRKSFRQGRGGVRPERTFQQRVVVKARVVQTRKGGGGKRLKAHLNYLSRSGVEREGEGVKFTSPNAEFSHEEMLRKVAPWARDPRHFRFIVSPQKGFDLNLDDFARSVMARVSADLGTKLEWYSVCHYNTDNPHVHILLRGVDERGKPLFISRDYIKRGMRQAAEAEATLRLGRRGERDGALEIEQDVERLGLTGTDHHISCLQEQSLDGLVRVRAPGDDAREWERKLFAATISRLHFLAQYELVTEVKPGEWKLSDGFLETLGKLSQQREIENVLGVCRKNFQTREPLQIHTLESPLARTIEGEILVRGLHNELTDQPYLVVSGSDGRLHYLMLTRFSEAEGFPVREGAVIKASPSSRSGEAVKVIARFSEHTGVFDLDSFRQHVDEKHRLGQWRIPEELGFEGYMRRFETRCETLAGAGIVQRVGPGKFGVPRDLEAHVEELERKLGEQTFTRLEVHSFKGLEEQVLAKGATWLDRVLVEQEARPELESRFGRRVQEALEKRGAEHRRAGRGIEKGLIWRLREDELKRRVEELAPRFGSFTQAEKLNGVQCKLEHYELLSDGYYMVLTHDRGFTLYKPGNTQKRHPQGEEFIVRSLRDERGKRRTFAEKLDAESGRARSRHRRKS